MAFETGVKSQSLDQRLILNGSAFYYDFENLQVSTSGFFPEVDNAAKAEVYGIDTDGSFAISDAVTLSGGVVWLPKREFVEFVADGSDDDLSGNKLSRAPAWSGTTAITYTQPWQDFGIFSLRLEYNYRSSFYFSKENRPVEKQAGFGLLNVFLRFESMSEKWYVFATGRNLTDEPYFNQIFLQSSPGYPANYEVGFGLRY